MPKIKDRNSSLKTLKVELAARRRILEGRQRIPLITAVIGALLNLILLIMSSIMPNSRMNDADIVGLCLVSVVWFVFVLGWMELLALDELQPLHWKFVAVKTTWKAS